MKKKDYELIASAFYPLCTESVEGNVALSKEQKYGARVAAVRMANLLENNSSKFNRDKFLTACGIENKSELLANGQHDLLSEEDYIKD